MRINAYHRTSEWFNSEIQAILLNVTISPCAACPSSSGVFSPRCPQCWDSQPCLNAAVDLPVVAISVLAHQQPGCTAALLSLIWTFRFLFLLLIFYSGPQLWKTSTENKFTNFRFHSVKLMASIYIYFFFNNEALLWYYLWLSKFHSSVHRKFVGICPGPWPGTLLSWRQSYAVPHEPFSTWSFLPSSPCPLYKWDKLLRMEDKPLSKHHLCSN